MNSGGSSRHSAAARSRRRPFAALPHLVALVVLLGVLGVVLSACGEPSAPSSPTSGAKTPTWTVFVYMNGDNNLAPSALMDLNKMDAAKLSPNVRVITMTDFDASQRMPDGSHYPVGSAWMRILGGGKDGEVLETTREQNLDDPAVLASAVSRAFRAYPADRYGLILWDHGGSWPGGFGGDTQNGAVQGAGMQVTALDKAVRAGLDGAGLRGSRPLQFLAFDACLMGGAEVAYQLRDLAHVYIANAEIDYGSGWNYTADFTWLARHPAATARQLAAAEVGSWNRLHAPAGADDAALRSHIALDTSRLPALARATKTLVGALASRPATVVTADRAAYVSCPPYWAQLSDGTGENSNNWTAGLLRDYGQFLEGLPADSPADVASSARAVSAALRSATIGTVDGSLRLGQSAFNITLPQARTMTSGWLDSYVAATPDWNSATGWADLLAATARVADKRPLRITATLGGSAQPTEAGPALVRVSSPGRDLGEARLTILRVASDGTFAVDYGVVSDGIANGSQIDLGWDGKLWTVGDPAQPAAASPWITLGALGKAESPPVLAVHGKIRSKGEVHEADLLFVPGEQRADTFVVISDGRATSMTTAEIHASASKAVFVPSVDSLVLDSGKILTVAGRPLPIPAAGISISEMKAPPGDYALYAEAEDTWGNDGADLTTMVKVR